MTTWSSATVSIWLRSPGPKPLGTWRGGVLELGRGGAGGGTEAIGQVAYRRDHDRDPVPALEALGRRTHAQHAILPVLLVHVRQDLLLHPGVGGDFRLTDERGSRGRADPDQHRTPAFDAFGLPGLRAGLDEDCLVIRAQREPNGRSLALVAVLAHGRDVNQL